MNTVSADSVPTSLAAYALATLTATPPDGVGLDTVRQHIASSTAIKGHHQSRSHSAVHEGALKCWDWVRMYGKCGSIMDVPKLLDGLWEPDLVGLNTTVGSYVDQGRGEKGLDLHKVGREKSGTTRSILRSGGMVAGKRAWHLSHALEALDLQVQRGSHVDKSVIYQLLRRCITDKDLVLGSYLHALAVKCGYESDTFLANHIICMYASHGRLQEATAVFTKVALPDRYMWASIILAHARHKQPNEAIRLYRHMRESPVTPDDHVFAAVLKACGAAEDLSSGIQVHADFRRTATQPSLFVGNCLIDMYMKCGSLEDARMVFDNLTSRDVVTWNAMIAGFAEHGRGREALTLYGCMQQEGITPANAVTFVGLVQACGNVGDLHQGKRLHAKIQEMGLEADVIVGNCLVTLYAKCGSLEDAHSVFDNLPTRDVVTWNAMIAGYAHHGHGEEALALYGMMRQEGLVSANAVTFVCLLQACGSAAQLVQGKEIHGHILEVGLENTNLLLANALIDMYCKCGSLEEARAVFDHLPSRDVVTWTSMIGGYAKHGVGEEALALFVSMQQQEAIAPADIVTFVCLLEACANMGALRQGRQLHAQIHERGLDLDATVATCLVNMYCKCGSTEDARRVFEHLPEKSRSSWNAMIGGYARHGLGREALALHATMQRVEGETVCDRVTLACLLQACASVGALYDGMQLHAQMEGRGVQVDAVLGSSLVDMYAKCGSLEEARRVFDALPDRDVVTWTAMMSGYVQNGLGEEALSLYATMQKLGSCSANHVMYACLLQACGGVGALNLGKQFHAEILERGLDAHSIVGNSLVHMYAKCGSLGDSRRVFDGLATRDVVAWNALLMGHAESGECDMAMQCFQDMHSQGVEADDSTFTGLLVACTHAGMVLEGRQYFRMMVEGRHAVVPTVNHYNCVVDLLGRSGHLDEAESMLRSMPFQKDVVGWTSLLNACKGYGDVERGMRCFHSLTSLDPQNATPYLLLANIFANAGRWEDVHRIEKLRLCAGAHKKPAKACIEVKKRVHEFAVGEPRCGHVSTKLGSVNLRLRGEGGHVPQTELVLTAMSEREKEDALCGHAEKLALAYGLMHTPPGTALLVTKNLRMCNDCHSSTKVMSSIERREILVRDARRLHRFVDGACSCRDRH